MTNAMKRNPRGGRGPRVVLYALGVIDRPHGRGAGQDHDDRQQRPGQAANLTSFSPLTVAPIANQSSTPAMPVIPISPTATDSQTSPFPVITWTATGLPPGHHDLPHLRPPQGTPTLAGTYQVTVTAKDNAHPPTYGSRSLQLVHRQHGPQIIQVVPVVGQGVGGIRVVITGQELRRRHVRALRRRGGGQASRSTGPARRSSPSPAPSTPAPWTSP